MDEIICPDSTNESFLKTLQKNLKNIESSFNLSVALRGLKIMYEGKPADKKKFRSYITKMISLSDKNFDFNENNMKIGIDMAMKGKLIKIEQELADKQVIKINGRDVFPKTYNQQLYINSMKKHSLVFGLGPAGTGKTFLAIAMAVNHLLNKKVDRIVLTRPVVEAGEKLGFLPGDIQQKVNPYFRPLYDSLYHLIGFEKTSDLIEKGIIEIAPLAYMRGRTINNSFIILDEGQNTVNSQMKMFLTRFGLNSRVVITADTTQIDLDDNRQSGIFRAVKLLKGIKEISIINLSKQDVVRHPLVMKIIKAYEDSQ